MMNTRGNRSLLLASLLAWLMASLVASGCTGTITAGGGEGEGADGDDIDGWGGNLPDTDDPVTPTAQKLVIESPPRGAMIQAGSDGTVQVAGRILDPQPGEELAVNGQPVAIGGDGRFSVELSPRRGPNIITATLSGVPGARAQRTFLHGEFADMDAFVPAAAALRVNKDGFSDDDDELDDISALVSVALAERDLIKLIPASYSFDMPVIGTVSVNITERSSDPARAILTPRAGGVRARVRLPDVRLRHLISFNCGITTCNTTGTATADAVEVTVEIDAALGEEAIDVATRDATIELVNFRNQQDGTLASIAQQVVEYFVPDLERRIEDLLQPAASAATSADLSLALGALSVPVAIDLRPALDLQLELSQRLDTLQFTGAGAIVGLALRAQAVFDPGEPGAAAPGWLVQGGATGEYRLGPPFGVSTAMDLVNQLLFAVWGQGALALELPLGDLGQTRVTALATPVLIPEQDRQGLLVVAGDIMLETSYNGAPLTLAVTIVTRAHLVADPAESRARLELIETPVLYAEMVEGPDAFTGLILTTLVERLGPELLGDLLAAVQVPLPSLPLDALADGLAGQQLRIAPPAEFVTGEPPARVTLYGRFAAQ